MGLDRLLAGERGRLWITPWVSEVMRLSQHLRTAVCHPAGTPCSLQGAHGTGDTCEGHLPGQGSSWAVSERAQEGLLNMGTGVEGP